MDILTHAVIHLCCCMLPCMLTTMYLNEHLSIGSGRARTLNSCRCQWERGGDETFGTCRGKCPKQERASDASCPCYFPVHGQDLPRGNTCSLPRNLSREYPKYIFDYLWLVARNVPALDFNKTTARPEQGENEAWDKSATCALQRPGICDQLYRHVGYAGAIPPFPN
jgi:hypothetical protein